MAFTIPTEFTLPYLTSYLTIYQENLKASSDQMYYDDFVDASNYLDDFLHGLHVGVQEDGTLSFRKPR